MGAGNVQVCTAAMTHGFKIVDDMIDGLNRFMEEKGFTSIGDTVGRAIPSLTDWQHLNLNGSPKRSSQAISSRKIKGSTKTKDLM